MKKTLLLLAMLPFVFMACEKEEKQDDTQNLPNEMIIRDTTYNLKGAYLNDLYTYRGKTYYDLWFIGDGINLDNSSEYTKITGNGKFFNLSLMLNDSTGIPTGNIADSVVNHMASYKMVNDDWQYIDDEWKSKSLVSVSKNGQTYNINFELTDSMNKKTSVRYKGQLGRSNIGR
jgi:hypothetical protein